MKTRNSNKILLKSNYQYQYEKNALVIFRMFLGGSLIESTLILQVPFILNFNLTFVFPNLGRYSKRNSVMNRIKVFKCR